MWGGAEEIAKLGAELRTSAGRWQGYDYSEFQWLLTPFLGTCLGWQDKVAVRCLQSGLPMRMVADEGEVERD